MQPMTQEARKLFWLAILILVVWLAMSWLHDQTPDGQCEAYGGRWTYAQDINELMCVDETRRQR